MNQAGWSDRGPRVPQPIISHIARLGHLSGSAGAMLKVDLEREASSFP